jgi:DNA-binding NarL/FixJ family response regulator
VDQRRNDSGSDRGRLPLTWTDACQRITTLTTRELEVLDLLGHGYDNRKISLSLGITERTVKLHITSILRKLGVESRLQAGLVAIVAPHIPLSANSQRTSGYFGSGH